MYMFIYIIWMSQLIDFCSLKSSFSTYIFKIFSVNEVATAFKGSGDDFRSNDDVYSKTIRAPSPIIETGLAYSGLIRKS